MEADDLYGLALDRFVPERTALARCLRKDGRREEATKVASLRKPSVAAWAVNQLVRTQSQAVTELLETGDELHQAHDRVVAGRGDGSSLSAAARRERDAVEALVNAARGLLTTEGHELSASVLERVGDTLHAAALDQDARARVREGRLERELRHVGLGEGQDQGAAPAPSSARRPPQASVKQAPAKRDSRAAKQAAAAKRATDAEQAAQAREAAKAQRVAQAERRRRADRAARALRVAQERRHRAAEALRDADEKLAEAVEQAQAAARELG